MVPLLATIVLILSLANGEFVTCDAKQHCSCNNPEDCTLHCAGENSCDGTILTCSTGYLCTINCFGSHSCKQPTKIQGNNAINVRLNCDGTAACENSMLTCSTTGPCLLSCPQGSCTGLHLMDYPPNFICVGNGCAANGLTPSPIVTSPPTISPPGSGTGGFSSTNTKPPTISPNTNSNVGDTTKIPTRSPTNFPTINMNQPATDSPTGEPTPAPTDVPSADPTPAPTDQPTPNPTSSQPTTPAPVATSTQTVTEHPTTQMPTPSPTSANTLDPTTSPVPTNNPTRSPIPTAEPTDVSEAPTSIPPSENPSPPPTSGAPTATPTSDPSFPPTSFPSRSPTTAKPTKDPTNEPTVNPTNDPTVDPTNDPSGDPTEDPTTDPTKDPTHDPTIDPTSDPTEDPTEDPTAPYEQTITCPAGQNCSCSATGTCTFSCNEANDCSNALLSCAPSVGQCDIYCEGLESCRSTNIIGNGASNISLYCLNLNTCGSTSLSCGQAGTDPGTSCIAECSNGADCTTLTCNPTAACPSNNSSTNIPTTSPITATPSKSPSSTPSKEPTYDPTIDPTFNPTSDPTGNPTGDPTYEPTTDPRHTTTDSSVVTATPAPDNVCCDCIDSALCQNPRCGRAVCYLYPSCCINETPIQWQDGGDCRETARAYCQAEKSLTPTQSPSQDPTPFPSDPSSTPSESPSTAPTRTNTSIGFMLVREQPGTAYHLLFKGINDGCPWSLSSIQLYHGSNSRQWAATAGSIIESDIYRFSLQLESGQTMNTPLSVKLYKSNGDWLGFPNIITEIIWYSDPLPLSFKFTGVMWCATSSPTTIPTNQPTKATRSPSFAPLATSDPSTDPTVNPTSNPTYVGPAPKRRLRIRLLRALDDLLHYIQSKSITLEDWAKSVVKVLCRYDSSPSLSNMIITILSVREGSIIIDFEIEVDDPNSLNQALDNINETVITDGNITVDGFAFSIDPQINTVSPTLAPTNEPTNDPTDDPTDPSAAPSNMPLTAPTVTNTSTPTAGPTLPPIAVARSPSLYPSPPPTLENITLTREYGVELNVTLTLNVTNETIPERKIVAYLGGIVTNLITVAIVEVDGNAISSGCVAEPEEENVDTTWNQEENEASISTKIYACDEATETNLIANLDSDLIGTEIAETLNHDEAEIKEIKVIGDPKVELGTISRAASLEEANDDDLLFYIIIGAAALVVIICILLLVICIQWRKLKDKRITNPYSEGKGERSSMIAQFAQPSTNGHNTRDHETVNSQSHINSELASVNSHSNDGYALPGTGYNGEVSPGSPGSDLIVSSDAEYKTPGPPPRRAVNNVESAPKEESDPAAVEMQSIHKMSMQAHHDADVDQLGNNGDEEYSFDGNVTMGGPVTGGYDHNYVSEEKDVDELRTTDMDNENVDALPQHVTKGGFMPTPQGPEDDYDSHPVPPPVPPVPPVPQDDESDAGPVPPPVPPVPKDEESEDSLDQLQHQFLSEEINREEDAMELRIGAVTPGDEVTPMGNNNYVTKGGPDFDGGFENDDNLLPPPIPPVPKGDSFDGIIGNTPQ